MAVRSNPIYKLYPALLVNSIKHHLVGAVEILGGFAAGSTGGKINITSGRSEYASYGDLFLGSPEAGSGPGVSGSIEVSTGFFRQTDSGSISIKTGNAYGESNYETQDSGSIFMNAGGSDEGNGGDVIITSGPTYSTKAAKGVNLLLEAGDARYDNYNHYDVSDGMMGGSVKINAGHSNGHSESDTGGSMSLNGGNSNGGDGGSVLVAAQTMNRVSFVSGMPPHTASNVHTEHIHNLCDYPFRRPCKDWFRRCRRVW